jgi:hypothetical protein
MSIAEKHSHAMDLAEQAFRLVSANSSGAIELFSKAYAIEREIADAIPALEENEPSRSIMYRSAASLALNAGLHRDAEIMVSQGLIGYPPEEIADELRDVFDQANFERHLKISGVDLKGNELMLTFVGNEVGLGYIRASELTDRLEIFSDITKREVERMAKKAFRSGGRPPKIVDMYAPFLGAQMAGSYKVILQLGSNDKDPSLFEDSHLVETRILDNIIEGFTLINEDRIGELKDKYGEGNREYFDFFASSAKSFAPDGDRIKMIGFTRKENGEDKSLMFRRERSKIKLSTLEVVTDDFDFELGANEGGFIVIEGILDLAKSRSTQKYIEVTTNFAPKPIKFKISEGKLAAIVRDNYESLVRVTGRVVKKGKNPQYEFVDIENLDDER